MDPALKSQLLTVLVVVAAVAASWLLLVWFRRNPSAATFKSRTDETKESIVDRQMTVVLRGPSAAVFLHEDKAAGLRIDRWESAAGPVTISYRTRTVSAPHGVQGPGHLWIEVVGRSPKLKPCIAPFANAALELVPVLVISANAAIRDIEVELAFDSTPSVEEREYFQSFMPPERGIPHPGRPISTESTIAILQAIHTSTRKERLVRAMNQYALALATWRLGHETLTVAHLWMALEALTPLVIERECVKRGLAGRPELGAALGLPLSQLDATARRDWLLMGDSECYKEAKDASDGFEHGYRGFGEMRAASAKHRRRIASLVRAAIFDLAGVPAEHQTRLLAAPYDQPLGHWPLAKYLWGTLMGKGDDLAAADAAYPFIRWKPEVADWSTTAAPAIRMQDTFTPELGPGIGFRPDRVEVWQPD